MTERVVIVNKMSFKYMRKFKKYFSNKIMKAHETLEETPTTPICDTGMDILEELERPDFCTLKTLRYHGNRRIDYDEFTKLNW